MDLSKYTYPFQSQVNTAIDDILKHLRLVAKDTGGHNLLESAERLLSMSMTDIQGALQPPNDDAYPFVRELGGTQNYHITTIDFSRGAGEVKIPLYFIYKSQDANFERDRQQHLDFCIRWLEQPDDEGSEAYGLSRTDTGNWYFKPDGWNCVIDHDTPFKFLRGITLEPPIYCSRVDLVVEVNSVWRGGHPDA
jgi:hypothetical protein